eukprot:g3474.t1
MKLFDTYVKAPDSELRKLMIEACKRSRGVHVVGHFKKSQLDHKSAEKIQTFDDLKCLSNLQFKYKKLSQSEAKTTVFSPSDFKHAKILHVMLRFNSLFPLIVYILTCVLVQVDKFPGDEGIAKAVCDDWISYGTILLSFMVVFFFGHCYSRYMNALKVSMKIERTIEDIFMAVVETFDEPNDMFTVWRYLTLAHAAAYLGLIKHFTIDNFFVPICDEFNLLPDPNERKKLFAAMRRKRMDTHYTFAGSILIRALRVSNRAKLRYGFTQFTTANTAVSVCESIRSMRSEISNLYHAVCGQVVPFPYLYLIRLYTFFFLCIDMVRRGVLSWEDDQWFWAGVVEFLMAVMTILVFNMILWVSGEMHDPFSPKSLGLSPAMYVRRAAKYTLNMLVHSTGVKPDTFEPLGKYKSTKMPTDFKGAISTEGASI